MGRAGSTNWHALLDSVEIILNDQGFEALTTRRIAEQTGVQQRLVYYYFRTLDDLIVEAFRRVAQRELDCLRTAQETLQPLPILWDICITSVGNPIISEFINMHQHIPQLREEIVQFITDARAIFAIPLFAILERHGGSLKLYPNGAPINPVGLAGIATSLALQMVREKQLQIDQNHGDIHESFHRYLTILGSL